MPTFIKGLELCELFYQEAVKPILRAELPDLRYSAGLIGIGSDVLGFDTEQSSDHNWGPRLLLFLSPADHARHAAQINDMLRRNLPYVIRDYPTNYAIVPAGQSTWMQAIAEGEVNHAVWIFSVEEFLKSSCGIDLERPFTVVDWLITAQQLLLSLTAGRIYHDGLGTLEPLRAQFAYYPHDLWLYLLASGWQRIAQEEAFMGRNGQVGDDLGSQVIASRLVHDVMMLCFLMEKQYAPYPKWFGSGFARLRCATSLTPLLRQALSAGDWREREQHLSACYRILAEMHNALEFTDPLPTEVTSYYDRPFKVIHGDQFAEAIRARITDEEVRRLPAFIGGIDQWVDSTDVLAHADRGKRLRVMYSGEEVC